MEDIRRKNIAPFMEAVGTVSAAWAHLELVIDSLIWELLGGRSNLSACVTMQFSSHYPKLKAIAALCAELNFPSETIKKLNKFMGSLTEVADQRNRLIHDAWLVGGGEIKGKVSVTKVRPGRFSSVHEIDSLRVKIARRTIDFQKLKNEIIAQLKSKALC